MKKLLLLVIACSFLTQLVGCGKTSAENSNVVPSVSQAESLSNTDAQPTIEADSEAPAFESESIANADSLHIEQSTHEVNDDGMVDVVFPPDITKRLGIPTTGLDEFCTAAGFESAEILDDGSISIRMTGERRHMLLSNCATSAVIGAAQTIIDSGKYGLLSAAFDYDTQSLALYVDVTAYESEGTSAIMLCTIPDQAIKVAASVEGPLCWSVTVYDNDSKQVIDEYSVENAG